MRTDTKKDGVITSFQQDADLLSPLKAARKETGASQTFIFNDAIRAWLKQRKFWTAPAPEAVKPARTKSKPAKPKKTAVRKPRKTVSPAPAEPEPEPIATAA
jgi:hypothetical protein